LVSLTGSRKKARIAQALQFSQSVNHALGAYAVGVWRFEDNVNDGSGYGNDGIINGDPQYIDSLSSLGRALDFDGAGDYVDCGNDTSLNLTDEITIEIWVKPNVAGEGGANVGPVCKAESGIDWSWQLRYNAPGGGNYMGFQFSGNPEGSTWVSVKENLSPGEWYYIVGTFDGVYIRCYLNAVEKDTNQISAITGGNSKFFIGQDGWDNFFNGVIDEIKIYDAALTIGQIQKHYVEGLERHNIVLK